MAKNYLKQKPFSPKTTEYPASSKHRGEVKSEPILISDEYEDKICSARRISFDSDGNYEGNSTSDDITTTSINKGDEVNTQYLV